MKTFLQRALFLSLLTTGLSLVKAQSASWQWARSAGYTGSEMSEACALDPGENLYAIGWYTSATITFSNVTLTNMGAGTGDIFLTKYDAAGGVLWSKNFGGSGGDVGNSVVADAGGNVYISGWFTSPTLVMGTFTLNNTSGGTGDVFVAKVNSSGNVIWAKSAGGSAYDRAYGITLDASGNVLLTGSFESSAIDFGAGSMANTAATEDFFVVKYDASGTALWSRSAGGTNNDAGLGIAADSLGNVYISGRYLSSSINFGTGALNNASSTQDFFMVKYNSSGSVQWSQRAGGTGDDYADDILISNGAVYITGGFTSSSITFGTTTLNNAAPGLGDIILAKFDLGGNPVWAKRAGGGDMDWSYDLSSDMGGNIYLSGTFVSNTLLFGSTTLTNSAGGFRDICAAAYDASGNPLWATSAGGVYDEAALGVASNPNGTSIYLGGFFNSYSISFGSYTVNKGCGDDVFVAKYQGPAVGIQEVAHELTHAVYPNPSQGKFNIEANGQIIIYNTLGQEVLNKEIKDEEEVDLSSVEKGVYIYKVISKGNQSRAGRIVVE